MTVRTGIGSACCCVQNCTTCYPLTICDGSENCPDSVYVSCAAAEWLDKQGAGYTFSYNPQCCLTWGGATGDAECDDVSIIIYSDIEGRLGKSIQSFDQADCSDCEEDPNFQGACCYQNRQGDWLCATVTQSACLSFYNNGIYQGDGTCCLNPLGQCNADNPNSVDCEGEPEPPECDKFAGLCMIAKNELVTRCGDPAGTAPDCADEYLFRLNFPPVTLYSGEGGGFNPCGSTQCINAGANGWVCCQDNLDSFTQNCEISKSPTSTLERWSGESEDKTLGDVWKVGTSACFTHDCPSNCTRCNQAVCTGHFPYVCPCCSGSRYVNFYFEAEIEETSITGIFTEPLEDNQCIVTETEGCSVWTVKIKIKIRTNSCLTVSDQCGECPQCWGQGGMDDCTTHLPEMTWIVRVDKCACPDEVSSNDAHYIEVEEMNHTCPYGSPCYGDEYCFNACPCKQYILMGRGGLTAHYVDWEEVKEGITWRIE